MKTPNPKCRLDWFLIEFIDWRVEIQLVMLEPSPELLIVLCAATHHVEIALQIITIDLGAAEGLQLVAC